MTFIKDTAIRDYQICKQFKQLRSRKVRPIAALFMIQDDYKFLHYDTIRKIAYVYSVKEARKEQLLH